MMKFNWAIDLNPIKESETIGKDDPSKFHLYATAVPTVDEIEDIISPMTADTVLQILRGQGIYWGWECERHVDNEIPTMKGKERSKINREVKKSNKWTSFLERQNKWRMIPWKTIPKEFQRLVRIYQANKKCSRKDAQEAMLPLVMQ